MSAPNFDFMGALRAAIAAEVAPLREEIRVLREELHARDTAQYLTQAQLGRLLGLKPAALSMRLKRGGELAKLARIIDGKRQWARAEIEALLQRQVTP